MSVAVNILTAAVADIQEAYDWYEEKSEGLGEKLLEEIDESFLEIQKNPFYQIRYNNIRCISLGKYPYMIHYYVDEFGGSVYVTAILHMKRSRQQWYKRKLS